MDSSDGSDQLDTDPEPSGPEVLLRMLVENFVYRHGNALAVTLLCGGRIISGEIVTPHRWTTEMKSFVASGHGTAVEHMLETLVAFGDATATPAGLPAADQISTFYMINAAVALTGDAVAPTSVFRRPWAVQAGQVAAWSMGTVLPPT